MATPTPVDTSSFTPEQLKAFNAANALGSGVPTINPTPKPPVTPPPVTPVTTPPPSAPAPTPAPTPTTPPAPSVAPTDSIFRAQTNRAAEEVQNITTNTDGSRVVTYKDGSQQAIGAVPQSEQAPKTGQDLVTANQQGAATLDQERVNAYNKFQTTVNGLMTGTTPLTPGEQAQVDALSAAYKKMIDDQKIVNSGAQGTANIRGYQTGAAEYDPTFQAKTIGSIVSAGAQKVGDLEIKMAGAVAQLTQALRSNDIANVRAAYDDYDKYASDRADTFQKTITDTQKAIKDAQDVQTKIQNDIDDIAKSASENGADTSTLAKISAATTVGEAISAAGDSLQKMPAGYEGYLLYKNAMVAKGLTPLDPTAWKAQEDRTKAKLKSSEAYDTAYATASGKAAGEAAGSDTPGGGSNFAATVSQATDFEPAKTQAGYKKDLQDLIDKGDYKSALLKIQNSVSKALTGDNKTQFDAKMSAIPSISDLAAKLQAYADAGGNTGLLKGTAEAISNKLGEVKDPAFKALATDLKISLQKYRHDMSGAAFSAQEAADYATVNPSGSNKLDLNLAILEGMKDNFQRQVDSTVEAKVGEGARNIAEYANAKQNVNAYVAANPDKADIVAQLYEVPGATDADVLQYINLTQ